MISSTPSSNNILRAGGSSPAEKEQSASDSGITISHNNTQYQERTFKPSISSSTPPTMEDETKIDKIDGTDLHQGQRKERQLPEQQQNGQQNGVHHPGSNSNSENLVEANASGQHDEQKQEHQNHQQSSAGSSQPVSPQRRSPSPGRQRQQQQQGGVPNSIISPGQQHRASYWQQGPPSAPGHQQRASHRPHQYQRQRSKRSARPRRLSNGNAGSAPIRLSLKRQTSKASSVASTDAASLSVAFIGSGGGNLLNSHRACTVIKGELENVLCQMRADSRYLPLSRFQEEMTDLGPHPLVVQMQDALKALQEWEPPEKNDDDDNEYSDDEVSFFQDDETRRSHTIESNSAYHLQQQASAGGLFLPDPDMYLPPFCAAVMGRDISAIVTGTALSALHKFLLYGFVSPGNICCERALHRIASAILRCTFEESSTPPPPPGGGGGKESTDKTGQAGQSTQGANSKRQNSVRQSSIRQSSMRQSSIRLSVSHAKARGNSQSMGFFFGNAPVDNDEQVVLKLLDLSALVVRCSVTTDRQLVLPSASVTGLLDTCLHVSHRADRASPLLKSAAASSVQQIVQQIFGCAGHSVQPARRNMLEVLAHLLNPAEWSQHSQATAVTACSLNLVNIALETCREPFGQPEIEIVQNDLCKYLLQWSATHDLLLLSMTLRVIFNMFLSIRNHLKIPLEVFLTSVHLRIVSSPTCSADEREVALESLLEFCQETALMQDLYLNYDCDVQCTNLYEAVVTTLAQATIPAGYSLSTIKSSPVAEEMVSTDANVASVSSTVDEAPVQDPSSSSLDSDSDSVNSTAPSKTTDSSISSPSKAPPSSSDSNNHEEPVASLNHLNRLGLESMLAILNGITKKCQYGTSHKAALKAQKAAAKAAITSSNNTTHSRSNTSCSGVKSIDSLESQGESSGNVGTNKVLLSEEDLQDRKRKKLALAKVCEAFNQAPFSHKWLTQAQKENLIETISNEKDTNDNNKGSAESTKSNDSTAESTKSNDSSKPNDLKDRDVKKHPPASPQQVAELLYAAPALDKVQLGEYLGKGPAEKYPFHYEVRKHFCELFSFTDLSFAKAFRKFLSSKFRLPGEAQCIDRLMEAFSAEYHRQQAFDSFFVDNDAVYVLAFSTIMLNTDLHNPTIKEANRMTLEQFLRNNRGINGGQDLPQDFLRALYDEIKQNEIQMQNNDQLGDFFSQNVNKSAGAAFAQEDDIDDKFDFGTAWDGILSKNREVSTVFFSTSTMLQKTTIAASLHDKEMFLILAEQALPALSAFLQRSWDDAVVVKAIRGLLQIAKVAAYFDDDDEEGNNVGGLVNDVLQILLVTGKEYIRASIEAEYAAAVAPGLEDGASVVSGESGADLPSEDHPSYTQSSDQFMDPSQPIPYGLLFSTTMLKERTQQQAMALDISGSAAHRGLLALDSGFMLLRKYCSRAASAWPAFIECLCELRNAHALPTNLSELDDFADSNGNVLSSSKFAVQSVQRLEEYYLRKSDYQDFQDAQKNRTGWFRSFFNKKADSISAQHKNTATTVEENSMSSANCDDFIERSSGRNNAGLLGSMLNNEKKNNHFRNSSRVSIAGGDQGFALQIASSLSSRALLSIAEAADVETLIQMGSTKLPFAELTVETLLNKISSEYPFSGNTAAEQNAIFSLELAARALLSNRDKAAELFVQFLDNFESILSRATTSEIDLPASPFIIERIVVTILRASIHLFDLPELRPNLRASLHLIMMTLPNHFLIEISDRLACGLAIILRTHYFYFDSANGWNFIGDTLDQLANYQAARVFVFDGIASTVEFALPQIQPSDEEGGEGNAQPQLTERPPPLSMDACNALNRILIRFILGFYKGDLSLSVPAMFCLEKLYRRRVELLLQIQDKQKDDSSAEDSTTRRVRIDGKAPDKEAWQNAAVAIYSVCRSSDADSSRHGVQCYQRIVLKTATDEIPEEKWVDILYLMVSKQPPVRNEVPRANTLGLFVQLLVKALPSLSRNMELREDLFDLVRQAAALVDENLRLTRSSHLFERTLQGVTYLCNQMASADWTGEPEFSAWVQEAFLAELEKVGVAGADYADKNKQDQQQQQNLEPPQQVKEEEIEIGEDASSTSSSTSSSLSDEE